ncbi:PIG-L family deacetylase [Candidatus Woesearchaeota archaeon]|nr:PIG-L family deacetylase [Candidatus Woesearchaeota archaeon]
MNYSELTKGTNLFVGAHPDDNFLGAFNVIRANPSGSLVLTLTNGATEFEEDYPVPWLDNVATPAQYAALRKNEERRVMELLGVPAINQMMLDIPDQMTCYMIPAITGAILHAIRLYDPDRIFTHEFPQSHPDHEVACYCTHEAVRRSGRQGLPILEYPLYFINADQRVNCRLTDSNCETSTHVFTPAERRLRDTLMLEYATQPDLPERYTTDREEFRVLRNPREFTGRLPESEYIQPWIRALKPEDVRMQMMLSKGAQ